ncbi:MAG TPA: MFS transporter, partial [Desulfobacterales bacterium]|nr:MFS transporter [Desulfobacterales bacterium]
MKKKNSVPNVDSIDLKGSDLRTRMGPLLLLTAIFFFNFTARVVYAPLMPEIEANLNITHAAAGSLFFYISIGYFITLLGSGWIAASLNHRRTIILSSVVLGLTLIFTAFSSGLWTIRITLLLLGASAGLYLPSGIATLTALINPRHWGKAIAIHELAPNLGFVMAPLLSELIMMWFSWRAVPVMLGVTTILLGVTFTRYGRGGSFTGEAP